MKTYKFIQEVHNLISAKFSLIYEKNQIAYVEIPLNIISNTNVIYKKSNDNYYTMKFSFLTSIENLSKSKSEKKRMTYKVFDSNNNFTGDISFRKQKGIFGYSYYIFNFKDKEYYIYEIGLGRKGIKIPIYLEDKQIALIEKDAVVKNFQDIYTFHIIDELYVDVVSMFCVYYDMDKYSNRGVSSSNYTQTRLLYTTNKKLKVKYNDEFIKNNSYK